MVLRLFFLLISTLLSVGNKCNIIKIISNILTVYNYQITLLTNVSKYKKAVFIFIYFPFVFL